MCIIFSKCCSECWLSKPAMFKAPFEEDGTVSSLHIDFSDFVLHDLATMSISVWIRNWQLTQTWPPIGLPAVDKIAYKKCLKFFSIWDNNQLNHYKNLFAVGGVVKCQIYREESRP